MVTPTSIQPFGNQLVIIMDNGTKVMAYPTGGSLFIVKGSGGTTTPPTDPPTGDIYNPWASVNSVWGWEDHVADTGRGGKDYSLAWGTGIKAPAAGTLHTTGGSGEYTTGIVGSAGKRSILYLDSPVARVTATGSGEAAGPLAAIVFQHQSSFGNNLQHYNMGEVCGYSGDSGGNPYSEHGAQTHLHVHGLDSAGARVDLLKFI